MGWIKTVADQLGGTEDALRLLIGQLIGYPVMVLYRWGISERSPTVQQLYFFLTGLCAGFFVLGSDALHGLYAILGTYLLLVIFGGTLASVITSFIFNFSYLLIGYWFTESDGYDICWTMPHCIICLRLIGLTFDVYDGVRASTEGPEVLSKDQSKAALTEIPGILEMLSHSYFIGGYFVGPQFGMKKFKELTSSSYHSNLPGSPVPYAIKRVAIGFLYMGMHVIGSMYIPANWPTTQEYFEIGFFKRMFFLGLWCKIILYKYLSFWLISEGVCILSGLSFNGVREDGKIDWKGCANVKLGRLETSSRFGHLIESFNINTNGWAAAYIYKRLKFMNNRLISQFSTLMFLAVWHGFHSGYFLTFFNEFITMNFEKKFMDILERSERVEDLMKHPAGGRILQGLGWLWIFFFMPLCFIPFSLLTVDRYLSAYSGTYFLLYVVYLSWPLWINQLKVLLKVKPRSDKKD